MHFFIVTAGFILQAFWALAQPSSNDRYAVELRPPATVAEAGENISQVINPSFAGMGIEPSNLLAYTGAEEPNLFSINLLQNLANYTGIPPHIRFGGNTQDMMLFDSSVDQYWFRDNDAPVSGGRWLFGPRFLQALDRFPPNTPITFGLNMGYNEDDSYQAIADEAAAVFDNLERTRLVSFEIGNEPDGYTKNGLRGGDWDGERYANEWVPRARSVSQQVLRPRGIPPNFFEPGCTANTVTFDVGKSFAIGELARTRIAAPARDSDSDANQTYIAAWNQHNYYWFEGVSPDPLTLDILMDLSTIREQFSGWVGESEEAFATGYPYVLREMASAGPIGFKGVSDTFGATLWTLNFFLYTASLNISSVEFHMTADSAASPWVPETDHGFERQVRTTYYAWAAMAQLVGGTCNTRVAALPISDYPAGYEDRLVAYATYQQDQLAAIVLINTKMANASESRKASVNFYITVPSLAGQTVYFSYLTADGADSTSETVWNGVSFEQSDDGRPTTVNRDHPKITASSQGVFPIAVRDSQAVVVHVGHKLGTGPEADYNATTCRSIGATQPVPSKPLPSGQNGPSTAPAAPASPSAATSLPTNITEPTTPGNQPLPNEGGHSRHKGTASSSSWSWLALVAAIVAGVA
ncbi:MAG: hypothetical protein M1831_005225 [Alyxoria varia]|nr:MAG: hypothetical protein M1831_005225 [Alyxoria varia]